MRLNGHIEKRNRAIQLLQPVLLHEKAVMAQHCRTARSFISRRSIGESIFYGLLFAVFLFFFPFFKKEIRRCVCVLEIMMRGIMQSSRSLYGDFELKCDWFSVFAIFYIYMLSAILVSFKISQGIQHAISAACFFKKPPTISNADILNAIEKQCEAEIDIPKELCCAISHEILTQPCYIEIEKEPGVWSRCAKTEYYERAILEAYLASQDTLGSVLCDPVTNIILSDNQYRIVNDHECAKRAEEFLDDQLDRHLNLSHPIHENKQP